METLQGVVPVTELTVCECDVLWEVAALASACFGPEWPVVLARGKRRAYVLAEV